MAGFKDFIGTMSGYFKIGGTGAPRIKNNSGVIEIKNSADNAFAKLRALFIAASDDINVVATLIDATAKVILYSFAGASPPTPGDNTGKFGFCHTAGGDYSANDVVYDTGSALLKVPRESCRLIITTDAVTGTVSLNADGIYGWEGAAYVLKGDGAATDTGFVKSIEVAYAYTDDGTPVDSTTSIPDGARILRVINDVQTLFNGTAPTVAVTVNGSSPVTIMATTDNDPTVVGQYDVEDFKEITATGTGVVRVTVTKDASTTGAGKIVVLYTTPGA